MSVAEALVSPRMHDQLIPDLAIFEAGFDQSIYESMRRRGHDVAWGQANSSGQALKIVDGVFEASGEPRQNNSGGRTV